MGPISEAQTYVKRGAISPTFEIANYKEQTFEAFVESMLFGKGVTGGMRFSTKI